MVLWPITPTWQHWATDKNYGGPESKGINSEATAFVMVITKEILGC
ncbi:endo-alpha-N-acetylgalactosaminidase family protein [Bacillus pacificus]